MANVKSAEPGAKGARMMKLSFSHLSSGTLLLESILMPVGRRLEMLPPTKKDVLKSGASTCFILFETDCEMYAPLPLHGMQTSPGIYSDPAMPTPSDPLVRYGVDYVWQITRRGNRFTTKEQVEKFMENPEKVFYNAPKNAFRFCVQSAEAPTFREIAGRSLRDGQPDKLTITSGKRKNVEIDLDKRRKSVMNRPSAPGKYSKVPHPLFELSEEALPEGTPAEVIERAKRVFSCSVTRHSQQNYATAVRHLFDAEQKLGSVEIC